MYEQWCSNIESSAMELKYPKWSNLASKKEFSWMLNLSEQLKLNTGTFQRRLYIKKASLNLKNLEIYLNIVISINP